MSEVAPENALPRHSRRVPEAWDGLVEFASETLASNTDPDTVTTKNATAMFAEVDKLDNEVLECNRYYGIGVAMCHFAKAMQDPDTRRTAVDEAATEAVQKYWGSISGYAAGLTVDDIGYIGITSAFEAAGIRAAQEIPTPRRLVADTLINVAQHREYRLTRTTPEPDYFVGDPKLQGIIDGESVGFFVGSSATGATSEVISLALKADSPDLPPYDPKNNAAIAARNRHRVNLDTLRRLKLRTLSGNIAMLRLDEITEPGSLEHLTEMDDTGNLIFQRDRVPLELPPPALPKNVGDVVVLHNKRLICPAIQVQGLVPLMLEIVPEIIIKAHEHIEAESAVMQAYATAVRSVPKLDGNSFHAIMRVLR